MNQTIEQLIQRIQQLEDTEAIRQLKYRYFNACDEKLPDQVLACFAPGEVEIDYGHIGKFSCREDFVAVFKAMGCKDNIVDMHHAQNPLLDFIDPDHARGKISLRFFSMDTLNKTSTQLGGYYLDEYRRINGQWLITRSHFHINAVELGDFSGELSKVTYAGNTMPVLSE